MLRRSVPLKPSRGTTWPPDVAQVIRERDRRCVGPAVGMAGTSGVEAQRRYKARQKERLERELAGGAMGAGEMTVT